MIYVLLLVGLTVLILAGDLLVRGAVGLSKRVGIPPLVIGLTIVAMGTSAPELVVSLDAAQKGAAGLALGNVVGSNITNVLFVLGVPALFCAIDCRQNGIRRSTLFMIAISVILIGLSLDGSLSAMDGVVLLAFLAIFVGYSFHHARRDMKNRDAAEAFEELEEAPDDTKRIVLFLVAGLIGLPLGAKLTTDNALAIAATWQVADSAVGLTIVALGTSLPEFAAGMAAAMRRQHAVAIGNVVGSNIFNILFILGLIVTFFPLSVPENFLRFDFWVMLATSALLLPLVLMGRKIGRIEGAVMTVAYLGYVYFVYHMNMVTIPGA
ncbi:calcium/sodium antiporter [Cucumibacter marinus]|uniref:calcium/sodium antiporter n=1 Tax=Cucumibacter marinus TaxID=1121252 RepID=UPI0004271BF8|nr:calcium/sodium antiporter [Cucumibacter marinus]